MRLGCGPVAGNLALLRQAPRGASRAYIVWQAASGRGLGNRRGAVARDELRAWADHVETGSVGGFLHRGLRRNAHHDLALGLRCLLRGKRVVAHGRPFYAGWGLTEDRMAMPRRERALTLDELVAGALLRYPIYWDWELKGYTTCVAVLTRIVETRDALEREGRRRSLRVGYARRQWRKLDTLLRARFAP